MRVALVCPYDLGVFGGVQTQVVGLAAALEERGHSVVVVGPGAAADRESVSAGRSLGIRANGSVAPIAPQPSAWRRTLKFVRDADVVHAHEPFVPGPSLACLFQSGVPVVGTFHQSGFGWPYRLAGPVVRLLGKRMPAVTAVSAEAARMVEGPLGREVPVLWNGVPRSPSTPKLEKAGPTVAFIGRHESRKGLRVLLEAFRSMAPRYRLWVVGEGPETEALKREFPDDRIDWLGRTDDAERDRRLANADVYCAPNLGGESFGLVIAEAMAAGAAVVASDIPAFRAVARPDHHEALLVPPGDPGALAAALTRVLEEADLRARMQSASRRRAEDFSLETLAARYEAIYGEVAASA